MTELDRQYIHYILSEKRKPRQETIKSVIQEKKKRQIIRIEIDYVTCSGLRNPEKRQNINEAFEEGWT